MRHNAVDMHHLAAGFRLTEAGNRAVGPVAAGPSNAATRLALRGP